MSELSIQAEDDYVQSANSLFHFMKEADYLKDALGRKALVPRYCVESVDYLGIKSGDKLYGNIAVLQKCFCDLPFHQMGETFALTPVQAEKNKLSEEEYIFYEKSNTHCSFYGEYGLAFSKSWGERNRLQPVHYLNSNSAYTENYSKLFKQILAEEDLPDSISQDVIERLSFIKPLRGIMERKLQHKDGTYITIQVFKNFHDEHEWRYVPDPDALASLKMECIIANQRILNLSNEISKRIEDEKYKALWLNFSYKDIRYIIVPDNDARLDIISAIMELPESNFQEDKSVQLSKQLLVSKLVVLSEIRKDW